MNTTHAMNANATIGFAQQPNPTAPALITRTAATPAALRKILVLGLLTVASCAAIVLVFKAAMGINDFFACLDAAYNSSSL